MVFTSCLDKGVLLIAKLAYANMCAGVDVGLGRISSRRSAFRLESSRRGFFVEKCLQGTYTGLRSIEPARQLRTGLHALFEREALWSDRYHRRLGL